MRSATTWPSSWPTKPLAAPSTSHPQSESFRKSRSFSTLGRIGSRAGGLGAGRTGVGSSRTGAGLSTSGQHIGAWWAPGIVYAPGLAEYVMWVSVPDALATNTAASGWDTRSIAALTATSPTGPWTYRGLALAATAVGQHYIDPFLFRDHDGGHYAYWKQYGGGLSSSIMGAPVTNSWQGVTAGGKVVSLRRGR